MMNKFWLVLMIAFLLFSGCLVQKNNRSLNWTEFFSDEGGFKANFPDTPKQSVKEFVDTTGKLRNIKFEAALPQMYSGVWYVDYPNVPSMNQNELKTYYDYQRDIATQQANTQMKSERDIWLNGRLGREMVLNQNDEIVIYRLYLIENRIFQVLTSFKSSAGDKEDAQQNANKFLDSFQLIEKVSDK